MSTTTYEELRTASLQCAAVLQNLGVRRAHAHAHVAYVHGCMDKGACMMSPGHAGKGDVVATLCCNTRRHLARPPGTAMHLMLVQS